MSERQHNIVEVERVQLIEFVQDLEEVPLINKNRAARMIMESYPIVPMSTLERFEQDVIMACSRFVAASDEEIKRRGLDWPLDRLIARPA